MNWTIRISALSLALALPFIGTASAQDVGLGPLVCEPVPPSNAASFPLKDGTTCPPRFIAVSAIAPAAISTPNPGTDRSSLNAGHSVQVGSPS